MKDEAGESNRDGCTTFWLPRFFLPQRALRSTETWKRLLAGWEWGGGIDAVGFDDERDGGEGFGGGGMDLDADEVEVVTAEGFDAGEVFQGAQGGGIGQWFVDAEVVAIGVEKIDGFWESLHGLAQGRDEVGEAGAAGIGAFVFGEGVGLHEQHEGAVLGFGGFGKGGFHPGDGSGVAGEEFFHGGGIALASVVVAADDVEGGKQDAAAGPPVVLDIGGEFR